MSCASNNMFCVKNIAAVILAVIFLASAAYAATALGFRTEQDISPGQLVSTEQGRSDYVVAANTENVSNLAGVAVAEGEAGIEFEDEQGADIFVVSEGSVAALVSDLNGSIESGDKITVSPLNGIGAKAVTSGKVVGTARQEFSAESEGAETVIIENENGEPEEISVGKIEIFVDIQTFEAGMKNIFSPLQDAAQTLTGEPVSVIKVALAFAAMFVAILISGILLWGSISSSITSIGRNPLARRTILISIIQVIFISILVVAAGAGLGYFIIFI